MTLHVLCPNLQFLTPFQVPQPHDVHRPRRALLLRGRGVPDGGGGHGRAGHRHIHAGGPAQGVQEDRAAAKVPAQVHLDIQGQEEPAHG